MSSENQTGSVLGSNYDAIKYAVITRMENRTVLISPVGGNVHPVITRYAAIEMLNGMLGDGESGNWFRDLNKQNKYSVGLYVMDNNMWHPLHGLFKGNFPEKEVVWNKFLEYQIFREAELLQGVDVEQIYSLKIKGNIPAIKHTAPDELKLILDTIK